MRKKVIFEREFIFMILEHMLQQILRDFLLMYKNFFHWNISKIMIYIASAVFAFLLGAPFILLALFMGYFDPIPWQEILSYYQATRTLGIVFVESFHLFPWLLLSVTLLMLLGTAFFTAGWIIYKLFISKLYLNYQDGKKILFEKVNLKYLKKIKITLSVIYLFMMLYLALNFNIISFGIGGLVGYLLGIGFFLGILFVLLYFSIKFLLSFKNLFSLFKKYTVFASLLFLKILGAIGIYLVGQFILMTFLPVSYDANGIVEGFQKFIFMGWFLFGVLFVLFVAIKNSFGYLVLLDEANFSNLSGKKSFKIGSEIFSQGPYLYVLLLIGILVIFLYAPLFLLKFYFNFSILYYIVVFLIFDFTFEMLYVSMYKRVLLPIYLKNHPKEISEQNKEEIV